MVENRGLYFVLFWAVMITMVCNFKTRPSLSNYEECIDSVLNENQLLHYPSLSL